MTPFDYGLAYLLLCLGFAFVLSGFAYVVYGQHVDAPPRKYVPRQKDGLALEAAFHELILHDLKKKGQRASLYNVNDPNFRPWASKYYHTDPQSWRP